MSHGGGGGDNFGMMIVLFLVVLFILWMWTGGSSNPEAQKPFIKPNIEKTQTIEKN